jgi:hypothetical protein
MQDVINEIVQKVLAEMNSLGLSASAPEPAGPAGPAKPTKPAPRASTYQPAWTFQPARKQKAPEAPRRIFITADMLAQRLRAGDGGRTIELACNEFLTPAAQDLADSRHLAVRRQAAGLEQAADVACASGGNGEGQPVSASASAPVPACGAPGTAPANGDSRKSLGLVVRQTSETVRGVLDGLRRDTLAAIEFAGTDCWIANTREMCQAVVAGRIAGGVVMVPFAAEAVALAGKIRGIRAVQGVRLDSLSAAIARLGPNVLVLEHSSCTFHELRTMLRSFAAGLGSVGKNSAVLDAIDELERS